MRKISLYGFVLFSVITLASCLKKGAECPYKELSVKAPDNEVSAVEQYLESKGIVAEKDASGLYYIVENAGTGTVADVCSFIIVNYTGSFTNDQVFAATDGTPVQFRLGGLISGWQKGLKYIKPGGKIKLFIPPSMGYGQVDQTDLQGNVVIPANSILIYTLELLDVQ
ncbi:MAG: FKBP-type peptidyl-prolyl cis-trans isomerase [Chitinophagaceae bacterium]|nr:FKBP-type peptidyl-prolyl cis-trans isomerase [Chitinophagaceae bacterium]